MITNLFSSAPVANARPEQPPSQSVVILPHLVFAIDSQPYACPVKGIERLMRFADTTVNPNPPGAPAWEVGQLEIEDRYLPVISLRSLWALPPLKTGIVEHERQALVVATVESDTVAVLVDSCICVIPHLPPAASLFHLPAALKGARGLASEAVAPWNGALLVVLKLDRLLQGKPPGERHPRQMEPLEHP